MKDFGEYLADLAADGEDITAPVPIRTRHHEQTPSSQHTLPLGRLRGVLPVPTGQRPPAQEHKGREVS